MRLSARTITAVIFTAGIKISATASALAVATATPVVSHDFAQPAAAVQPVTQHMWSAEAVRQLQSEAAAAADEGLDPDAYNLHALAAAASLGQSAETDQAATRVALALARDYAHGRVTDRRRFDWHIEQAADLNSLSTDLRSALRENRVRPWLRSLLPQDPRYAALRAAYVATPHDDRAKRDRLRANLERWRWMPRDLGSDHIFVNVPSYTLDVVDNGQAISTYTVVVGKPATPTPQIAVEARSIVVNPWWNVPRSIAAKLTPSAAKGFETVRGGGLRQRPGPANALGKIKIDMPNEHAIYLHDTPSKDLFARSSRAFSHGCIRVKDIDRLAAELAALDRGDGQAVRNALAGSATRTVPLQSRRPVYLVYFTAEASSDGKLVTFEDPYGRDRRIADALDGATRTASRSRAQGRI